MTGLTAETARIRIREFLKDIRVCMLTTVGHGQVLHSRPMVLTQLAFDDHIWFFSRRSCAKTREIERLPQANVTAQSSDRQSFLSLSGTIAIVESRAKMDSLWNDAVAEWFPEGVEDPDLVLLRMDIESAELWNAPGPVVTYVRHLVEVLSGEPVDDGVGAENVTLLPPPVAVGMAPVTS